MFLSVCSYDIQTKGSAAWNTEALNGTTTVAMHEDDLIIPEVCRYVYVINIL
jgi:hypothetical protein